MIKFPKLFDYQILKIYQFEKLPIFEIIQFEKLSNLWNFSILKMIKFSKFSNFEDSQTQSKIHCEKNYSQKKWKLEGRRKKNTWVVTRIGNALRNVQWLIRRRRIRRSRLTSHLASEYKWARTLKSNCSTNGIDQWSTRSKSQRDPSYQCLHKGTEFLCDDGEFEKGSTDIRLLFLQRCLAEFMQCASKVYFVVHVSCKQS